MEEKFCHIAADSAAGVMDVVESGEDPSGKLRTRLARRHDRRCLGSNRFFYEASAGELRAWAVRDLPAGIVKDILADPDAVFKWPGVRFHKRGVRGSLVAEVSLALGQENRALIYKRFPVRKKRDFWTSVFRPPPAVRSWICGHGLLHRGVPTARPLALIQRRRGWFIYECYLLTEKVCNAITAEEYLTQLSRLYPAERRKKLRRFLETAAHIVRRLHLGQCSNRDMKTANLMIQSDGVEKHIHLIDLSGAKLWRWLPNGRKAPDLARLALSSRCHSWISHADRLRFLRTYMNWERNGKQGWKRWWRRIAKHAQAKIDGKRQ